MNNKYIVLIFGILVKIVDDINDMKIFTEYKVLFEILLIIMSIYVLFFNKDLSMIASAVFFLGGILGLIFTPIAVEASIWKKIIILSIIPFFYHLYHIQYYISNMSGDDIKNICYFVIPLFIAATIFSVIEDKLVPEDNSYRKLIDKSLQVLMMAIFLIILPLMAKKIDLNKKHTELLEWMGLGWLGYVLTNVLTLIYFFSTQPKE